VGDDVLLQQVMNDPNCFVFNEMFPGGFTPQFGGTIDDMSLVGGIKGSHSGLRWDLSAGVGRSEAYFIIQNTVNASLGPDTPTKFNPGTYTETDQNINLDLAYPFEIGLYSPLNIAGGLEYREEKFVVTEGDQNSFVIGPLFDQGFSIGSNGFPGFGLDLAGSWTRRNMAGYLDFESDVLSMWRLGLAGRAEYFDTFGATGTAKISTLVKVFEEGNVLELLAIRATGNTGFRAPTPGQANVSNVTTIVAPGQNTLVNRGTIPPTNPIAMAFGGKELTPEKALNASGGLIAKFFEFLTLTSDFYWIKVSDRISQSATIALSPADAMALEESGIPGASDLSEFRYYTNAFDTITTGVDVIATANADWTAGQTALTLAFNYNKTKVDSYTEGVIDDQRILELENWTPKERFVGSLSHSVSDFTILGRFNFFGNFMDPQSSGDYEYGSQYTLDLQASYRIGGIFTVTVGAENVLDSYPDKEMPLLADILGLQYPQNAPSSAYGGYWYGRVEAKF
jgi:iron complex outermembrane receptor protein